jgi:phosphatidylethanolamine-binding protein (PEBP) family uncharacterized protein
MMHNRLLLTLIAVGALMAGCSGNAIPIIEEASVMSIQITSTAFADGGSIPSLYTCDGEDISPPLTWSGTPDEAKSLALISDDPDAPGRTWVHWVVYDLPPDSTGLPEGVPATETISGGGIQGKTDFGRHAHPVAHTAISLSCTRSTPN